MDRARRRVCAAVCAVALAGCAAIERPPATRATLVAAAPEVARANAAVAAELVERLADRAIARGDATLDVLLLSGGGQNGAYGAGFLRGWQTNRAAPMPRFDLVTGVSTGSLQAPFALLGTPAALDTLGDLYGRDTDAFAPKIDWFAWLRRTGGVLDTSRLRARVAEAIDVPLVRSLRAEFDAGRRLVVATTDFDLGLGRLWSIERESAQADGLARTHAILAAATALPGLFPPMVLDGHVHADGGVVDILAPAIDLSGWRRLGERLRDRGVTTPVTVRVWVVMNLWTHAPIAAIDPADRSTMSSRTTSLLFWTGVSQSIARLDELAAAVSGTVPNLRMQMRHTAIPAGLAADPRARAVHDAAWMKELQAIGYARARGDLAWDPPPSVFARPAGELP